MKKMQLIFIGFCFQRKTHSNQNLIEGHVKMSNFGVDLWVRVRASAGMCVFVRVMNSVIIT